MSERFMKEPEDFEPSEGKADLISGGDGIAEFLFGASDEKLRRKVYHLAESHDLPTFRIGNTLYARKSKLLEWVDANERRKLTL